MGDRAYRRKWSQLVNQVVPFSQSIFYGSASHLELGHANLIENVKNALGHIRMNLCPAILRRNALRLCTVPKQGRGVERKQCGREGLEEQVEVLHRPLITKPHCCWCHTRVHITQLLFLRPDGRTFYQITKIIRKLSSEDTNGGKDKIGQKCVIVLPRLLQWWKE